MGGVIGGIVGIGQRRRSCIAGQRLSRPLLKLYSAHLLSVAISFELLRCNHLSNHTVVSTFTPSPSP
jgi:hypothetical protein